MKRSVTTTPTHQFETFIAAGRSASSDAEPEGWGSRIARTRVAAVLVPVAMSAAIATPALGQLPQRVVLVGSPSATEIQPLDWDLPANGDVWVPMSATITGAQVAELDRLFAMNVDEGVALGLDEA